MLTKNENCNFLKSLFMASDLFISEQPSYAVYIFDVPRKFFHLSVLFSLCSYGQTSEFCKLQYFSLQRTTNNFSVLKCRFT